MRGGSGDACLGVRALGPRPAHRPLVRHRAGTRRRPDRIQPVLRRGAGDHGRAGTGAHPARIFPDRAEVGVVAICAAAINDVVGWLLLAGISAYAVARFSGTQGGAASSASCCSWYSSCSSCCGRSCAGCWRPPRCAMAICRRISWPSSVPDVRGRHLHLPIGYLCDLRRVCGRTAVSSL